MVGMIDPERPEVVESIKTFKRAGIKTVMITGDHKDTALAIAKKLGIAERPDECVMGHELDEMTDEELRELAARIHEFEPRDFRSSRVFPRNTRSRSSRQSRQTTISHP